MPKAREGTSAIRFSPDSQWPEGSPLHLWYLLARTRDAVYRARRKDVSESGITGEQCVVLGIIEGMVKQGLADKVTPAEIGRQMFRESQSVSELLHRMRRDGLIAKVRDLDRKNMVRIEMTQKGRDQLEAALRAASIARIMSRLSREQREQLTTCLTIIREAALDELGLEDVPIPVDYERQSKKANLC